MSAVIQSQTLIKNTAGFQVVFGSEAGVSSSPYITVTYNSSIYSTVRPLFLSSDNISVVDWGDGVIEYPNNVTAVHTYTPPGIYTAKLYSNQFSQEVQFYVEEGSGGGNVTSFDATRIGSQVYGFLGTNTIISSFTTGTTNMRNYPNLQSFDFRNNTTFTYTAGMLGQYNPFLNNVDLRDCGFTATETNQLLVDLQTYCLNNRGTVRITGTNAAPTVGPPNGIAARTALTGSGWSVFTN